MIVVRLPPVTHFETRATEWVVAGMLVTWCITLAQPDETMLQPQFSVLHHLASETFWTWACGVVGVARLIALWMNGSWQPSPIVRGVTAFLSGAFWVAVSFGLIASGRTTTGFAIYPWLVLLDLKGVYRATKDARVVWNRRSGSVSTNARTVTP